MTDDDANGAGPVAGSGVGALGLARPASWSLSWAVLQAMPGSKNVISSANRGVLGRGRGVLGRGRGARQGQGSAWQGQGSARQGGAGECSASLHFTFRGPCQGPPPSLATVH